MLAVRPGNTFKVWAVLAAGEGWYPPLSLLQRREGTSSAQSSLDRTPPERSPPNKNARVGVRGSTAIACPQRDAGSLGLKGGRCDHEAFVNTHTSLSGVEFAVHPPMSSTENSGCLALSFTLTAAAAVRAGGASPRRSNNVHLDLGVVVRDGARRGTGLMLEQASTAGAVALLDEPFTVASELQ